MCCIVLHTVSHLCMHTHTQTPHAHTHTHTHTHTYTAPEILTAPQPQLVPFNLDAMVTFSCTVRGMQLIWQVNTAQLVTDEDKMDARNLGIFPDVMDIGGGMMNGTLRINVSESNQVDMTRILCIAVGSSTLIRNASDLVMLITFGEFISPCEAMLMALIWINQPSS